jgi:heme oxygenase (biliverdin-IX-beta and delta-forming)
VADSEAIDRARELLRGTSYGALASIDRRDGAPIATLAAAATDRDGCPLLLLSDLAEHAKNLAADPRASLLIDGTAGLDERLTGPRLTVIGRVERTADEAAAARYRARHPQSAMLSGFGDFHLYRLVVERAHQVAGFGRIDGIDGADLKVAPGLAADLAGLEPDAIRHMHDDHQDALCLLAGAAPGDDVVLAAIDADGIDLVGAGRPRRVDFAQRLAAADGLRAAMAALCRAARGQTAGNDLI